MLLELQTDIIYGPVRSRRIGSSLGVNILPTGIKVCTFDCLYCQYGWTDFEAASSARFHTAEEVERALECALGRQQERPRYITLSGNGEPTMHPDFGRIVDVVNGVRDRLAPETGTAILSNSSRTGLPEVREALGRLDLRIMKLDAGSPEMLAAFNRPAPDVSMEDIIEGLIALPDVTIQALFTKGPAGNFRGMNIFAWLEYVQAIDPVSVQVYTLDRGCPSTEIVPLDPDELSSIRAMLTERGIGAEIF